MESILNLLTEHRLVTVISALSLIVLSILIHYHNAFQYWSKRGIKGPKPYPIVGNMLNRLLFNPHRLERGMAKKYGKLYGTYAGSKPHLVVADAEVLRQICIKDFDKFPNHRGSEFFNKFGRKFLFNLRDDHWRKARALMSPTFTSGKIKRMFKLLDSCADDLVLTFKEKLSGGSKSCCIVNVKDHYNLYTMDAISTCCYGLKVERAGSTNLKTAASRDQLVKYAMALFEAPFWRPLTAAIFPKTLLRLIDFHLSPESIFEPLAHILQGVITKRRSSGKKIDDYLQLLIDANLEDKMELNESDALENHHAGLTKESILEDQKKLVEATVNSENNKQKNLNGNGNRLIQTKYALTDLETLSNAMFLMMVGLETTGTMLSNCTYSLAFNQDIQQKLYEEILKVAEFNEDKTRYTFDYEKLTSCVYLDAVISETLRILTNVFALNRDSTCDYLIEKYNLVVEKHVTLDLAFFAILNDPDYWPEPRKFKPDRFLPENRDKIVPGAYCPFGIGPRHCIGMRFSLTESKLALAKILMNYRFEPAPNTSFPPDYSRTLGLPLPHDMFVKMYPRNTHSTSNI